MTSSAFAWWVVVGAGAGWFSTTVIGTGDAPRPFIELLIGVVGAILAGLWVQSLLTGPGDHTDSATIVASAAGACVLLALWRWVSRPKPNL
ncbi:MAG: GlsB/YeaQ/YmgE family stress response membrane protein [Archangium sp.]